MYTRCLPIVRTKRDWTSSPPFSLDNENSIVLRAVRNKLKHAGLCVSVFAYKENMIQLQVASTTGSGLRRWSEVIKFTQNCFRVSLHVIDQLASIYKDRHSAAF